MNKNIKLIDLKTEYDENFNPPQEYLDSLPDIQNGKYDDLPIDFVGIHNFHVPLRVVERDAHIQEVMASVTGSVSLEATKRGINMSRIIRTFYKSKDIIFNINRLEEILRDYQKDLSSFDAHLLMNFKYRIWQNALRSVDENGNPEGGWQYYNVTFDCNLDKTSEFKKIMWLDFVYSSACPCSNELSVHMAYERGIYGIPHSQRSVARIGIEFKDFVWIEDVVDIAKRALKTETLVFCKRIDEQAFAELNGASPKFVEDAIRDLAAELNKMSKIIDFKVICSHQESLHSHNAIAVTTKGLEKSIFNHHVSLGEFQSLQV